MVCQLNAKKVCEEIIEDLIKEGYRHQISHRDLVKTIMQKRNIIDERSINRWINALINFEYLIPQETTIFKVYKLNPTAIPHLFQILNNQPQTKIQ